MWGVFTDERWELLLNSAATEVPKIVTSLVLLGMGWLIGHALSGQWAKVQKRKEQDLIAAAEFHKAYGQFFATWKLWNYFLDQGDKLPGSSRWVILEKACQAEAVLEATLVRLASQRKLTEQDRNDLGKFRQIFQRLRECIRDSREIPWRHAEHPEYAEFKRLATRVAALVGEEILYDEDALKKIAANTFEPPDHWTNKLPSKPVDQPKPAAG